MKISYNLQLEDVVALQKYLLSVSKKHRVIKNITRIIVPLVLAVMIVFKIVNNQVLSQQQIILFGVLALVWIILHQLFFDKLAFRKVKKTVESQKNNLGLGKNSVEITNFGINFWQKKENLLLPFSRFVRLEETEKHLFLIIGNFAGITVNKETVDIKNFEAFVQKFREKIKN